MSASDRRALTLALTVGSALASSCARAPDVPDTPDVSRLLSAYAAPTGTVDSSRPVSWLEAGAAQLDMLGGGEANVVLAEVAASAFAGVDRASLPNGHDGVLPTRIDGVATLEVSCGAASHEIADVAVAIVDGAISPLLWGTAHACPLWQGLGLRESYDGRFTMYRYPARELFVRVDGTLTRAGWEINLDFRLSDGLLETRIATPTGDVIVARKGAVVLARAANGRFRCNVKQRACAREE